MGYDFQIYSNGYVTFGLNYDNRYPDRFGKEMLSYAKRGIAQMQGFAMLAPLWTDNDARTGTIYYQIYDLTRLGPTDIDKARVRVSYINILTINVTLWYNTVNSVVAIFHTTCGYINK